MEPCRYGILGAGRIAARFSACFEKGLVPGARLCAVASSDPQRAARFAAEHGIARSYGSHDALLADPEIEIVYIATINSMHYDCCARAIRAGKHVLCEKPLVLTAAEARSLAQLAAEHHVFLMEAMWTRFLPAVQTARRWLEEGRIGRLRCISASLCASRDPAEYPRLFDPALGGGAFYDLGVYAFSCAQFFAGGRKLTGMVPLCVPSGTGVDGSTFLTLSYEDGLTAQLKCSIQFAADNSLLLCGEQGMIRLAPWFNWAQRAELYRIPLPGPQGWQGAQPEEVFLHETSCGFEFEAEHAATCVRAGLMESDVMPLADSIACAELFDQLEPLLHREN